MMAVVVASVYCRDVVAVSCRDLKTHRAAVVIARRVALAKAPSLTWFSLGRNPMPRGAVIVYFYLGHLELHRSVHYSIYCSSYQNEMLKLLRYA